MEGTRDMRNDSKTGFLIKPHFIMPLKLLYSKGEGGCQVCWNSDLETSLADKEILRVCDCSLTKEMLIVSEAWGLQVSLG